MEPTLGQSTTQQRQYAKHFLPLESNPEVFDELIALLGAPPTLSFEDIFTLDDPAFLPHPALALVLVFPANDDYEIRNAASAEYNGCGDGEPVVWFRQTIHNACGLYAVLHALSNGEARRRLKPGSLLSQLLEAGIPLPPDGRARVLEGSAELEQAHACVAVKGDSTVPQSAEDEVDYHYICFVRSEKDSHVYELDGDLNGPSDTGLVLGKDEDVLCDAVVKMVQTRYIEQANANIGFNLMALVKK